MALSGRTAVILFNLGGPDSPDAVQPFLFNLFNDPAIIGLPGPLRWLVAKLISKRRAPVARDIYAKIGGSSPLVPQTRAQARALEQELGGAARVFIAMRYWQPFAASVVADVKAWRPDRVVLLPLYPQFSTTTSASSLKQWHEVARAAGLDVPAHTLCCWPDEPGFIAAQADLIRQSLARVPQGARILFSAHGLPKKIVQAGDPYQWQVERTASALITALGAHDHVICYQSRVGPLEWIGPSTEDEIARAGREKKPVVVVPLAFVSEHSETLVELDIEYREKAHEAGVPHYERVPTVTTHPAFITGLGALVRWATERDGVTSATGQRICPGACSKCAMGA